MMLLHSKESFSRELFSWTGQAFGLTLVGKLQIVEYEKVDQIACSNVYRVNDGRKQPIEMPT